MRNSVFIYRVSKYFSTSLTNYNGEKSNIIVEKPLN